MSDCLRIRLRPTGPWRIAPDSGERDRAGRIFHSDTLYSAVCTAMLRLGTLEEWLAVTALDPTTARVRFTSLFPYQGDTLFLPAPRGLWPPPPSSKLYAHAARFLPQSVAARLFEGKPVQEDRWVVDGASQCLLPSSSREAVSGPFRLTLRAGAAVDRLVQGNCEVHRTACLEFAPNAGLWFIVQFADVATRKEWGPRVTGALCLLADSGFGGRRSIGWGQCDFVHAEIGSLSDLVLGRREAPERRPKLVVPPEVAPEPVVDSKIEEASQAAPFLVEPLVIPPSAEPVDAPPPEELVEPVVEEDSGPLTTSPAAVFEPLLDASPDPEEPASYPTAEPDAEPQPLEVATDLDTETASAETAAAAAPAVETVAEAAPLPTAWWLLSLFTPSPTDAIDWQRGAYSLLERSGRIDSPQSSGEIKKSLRMVEEGSLLFAPDAPLGSATDVAPDGFPHPVYRSGYAVALRVPFRGAV